MSIPASAIVSVVPQTMPRSDGGGGAGQSLLTQTLALSPAILIDPSQLWTMKQEITGGAASTPAAVDAPVGTVKNLGTLADYYTAPATNQRPILRQSGELFYLDFDGVNDVLNGPAFPLADQHDVIAACRVENNVSGNSGGIFNYGAASLSVGSEVELDFYYNGTVNRIRSRYPGLDTFSTGIQFPRDVDVVLSQSKRSTTDTRQYLDGAFEAIFATATTAWSTTTKVAKIGPHTNAAQYFDGRLHAQVAFQSNLAAENRAIAEAWAASKQGRTL